jgi:hypothetical protein
MGRRGLSRGSIGTFLGHRHACSRMSVAGVPTLTIPLKDYHRRVEGYRGRSWNSQGWNIARARAPPLTVWWALRKPLPCGRRCEPFNFTPRYSYEYTASKRVDGKRACCGEVWPASLFFSVCSSVSVLQCLFFSACSSVPVLQCLFFSACSSVPVLQCNG